MHQMIDIRTSLEVGFPAEGPPEALVRYRGKDSRTIGSVTEFPYEDGQFDVVLMDGSAVSKVRIKEAHRVLKPNGNLFFIVKEKTSKQDGYTLPEIYTIVRYGFNIVGVKRPAWWFFGIRGRTISIQAQKKTWKALTNTYRPYT